MDGRGGKAGEALGGRGVFEVVSGTRREERTQGEEARERRSGIGIIARLYGPMAMARCFSMIVRPLQDGLDMGHQVLRNERRTLQSARRQPYGPSKVETRPSPPLLQMPAISSLSL